MRKLFTPPNPAERGIFVALAGLAGTGSLLGFEALQDLQAMTALFGASVGEWFSALAGAVGGASGGGLMRDRFGQPGALGGLSAVLGVFLATMLLGIVAGTLVLPLFGTMFGPWLIVVTTVETPWILLPWVIALFGLHLAMKSYVREQATLDGWETEPAPKLT